MSIHKFQSRREQAEFYLQTLLDVRQELRNIEYDDLSKAEKNILRRVDTALTRTWD